MRLDDVAAVQREQIKMADEILELTAERRAGRPDAILVVPAINPFYSRTLLHRLQRKGAPKYLANEIINGSGYLYQSKVQNEDQSYLFAEVLRFRRNERFFYDAVGTCYGAPRRDPIFRAPQVPGSMFDRLDSIGLMKWDQSTVQRSTNKWNDYGKQLSDYVGHECLRWIATHANSVTVVSDLPVEWCQLDGVPLSYRMRVNRIPLTPGNLPARLLVDHRPPVQWKKKSDVRLLVVSGHAPDDHLKGYPKIVAEYAARLGFAVDFVEVRGEKEFFQALVDHKPSLLFLSSHGVLTKEHGAALAFEDGPSSLRSDFIDSIPDCAVVSACRSDAVARTYGSAVTNLFGAGVRSVVGSYLNLTEPHASMVAMSLLSSLDLVLTGKRRPCSWDELAWSTLMLRRPYDVLVAVERRIGMRAANTDVGKAFERFAAHLDTMEPDAFEPAQYWQRSLEVLRTSSLGTDYEDAMTAVIDANAFRPESMFYTIVGMRDQILLGDHGLDLVRS